jgi:hypothetical protein
MPILQQVETQQPSNTLHVVSVVSNPVGFASRYNLYRQFEKNIKLHNVNLVTVELAFGDRNFEVTDKTNPNHVQVRAWDELWHKENMINIGIGRLPSDWQYVAWIDADIHFHNPNWVNNTLNALQHHMVVQPFSDCIDLGPQGETLAWHKSFCAQYVEEPLDALLKSNNGYGGYNSANNISFPHPGYAWAARREAIDGIGGLMDWAILGSADHHMAWAFVGHVMKSYPGNLHNNYLKRLLHFQERCDQHIKHDIGYVKGTILHSFHGPKTKRKYQERWSIIKKHQYDPERDIIKDSQGVYYLGSNKIGLRDDLRKYFRQRDEDDTCTE